MIKQFFQIRVVLFFVMTFLVSGWVSCTELKYMVWGEEAAATIMSVKKTKSVGSRHTPPRDVLAVRYEWVEPGYGKRRDLINREMDWAVPADGMLQISYLPGAKGSRLVGQRNLLGPIVFFVMTAAMVIVIVQTWREGSKE